MENQNVELGPVLTICDIYLVPKGESWNYPVLNKTISSPDYVGIVGEHLDAFSGAWERLADL